MKKIHLTEVITMPLTSTTPQESSAPLPYQVDRTFEGDRTAEQVILDLIRVHDGA